LLIATDIQYIAMDSIIEGGNPNARLLGNHVQELDREGNVVFEWRCWDQYNRPKQKRFTFNQPISKDSRQSIHNRMSEKVQTKQ